MTKLTSYAEFHQGFDDRTVLFGGSPQTLGLLRLALIRSDNVLLVASRPDLALSRYAERMQVERRFTPDGSELDGALAVLVSDGHRRTEDAVIRDAKLRSIPVYVADRPRISDFTMLDFLYRRPLTLALLAPPAGRNRGACSKVLDPADRAVWDISPASSPCTNSGVS